MEQIINFLLITAAMSSNLRQPLVRLVARLIDDVGVEERGLLVEEGLAEVPEFVWIGLEDSGAGFVDESGGWVPGLN